MGVTKVLVQTAAIGSHQVTVFTDLCYIHWYACFKFKHSLMSVDVNGCMYVYVCACVCASLRLNSLESKGDSMCGLAPMYHAAVATVDGRQRLMCRSLWGTALLYLVNSCTSTVDFAGRQHLQSASQRKLIVPHYRLNSVGRRCFAVAGPSTWNSQFRQSSWPNIESTCLGISWRHTFFAKYWRDVLAY